MKGHTNMYNARNDTKIKTTFRLYITAHRHLRVDWSFTEKNKHKYLHVDVSAHSAKSLIFSRSCLGGLMILIQPFRGITTGQDGHFSVVEEDKNPSVQMKKQNIHCYKLSSKRLNLLFMLHPTV